MAGSLNYNNQVDSTKYIISKSQLSEEYCFGRLLSDMSKPMLRHLMYK